MLNKKKIIFPAAYFCSWNGGTKLIKMCLDSILYFDKKKNLNTFFYFPIKIFYLIRKGFISFQKI